MLATSRFLTSTPLARPSVAALLQISKATYWTSKQGLPSMPTLPEPSTAWKAYLNDQSQAGKSRAKISEEFAALTPAQKATYEKMADDAFEICRQNLLMIVRSRRDTLRVKVPVRSRKQLYMLQNYPIVQEENPKMSRAEIYEQLLGEFEKLSPEKKAATLKYPANPAKRSWAVNLEMKMIRENLDNLKDFNVNRNLSSWNVYMQKHHSGSLVKESGSEITSLSEQYAKLSDEEKKALIDEVDNEKKQDIGPLDFEKNVLNVCAAVQRKYGGREKWRKSQHSGKVRNGYNIFVREFFAQPVNADLSAADRFTAAAKVWNSFDSHKKEDYQKLATRTI